VAYLVIGFILGLLAGAGGYVWIQRQLRSVAQYVGEALREPVREIVAAEVERLREQKGAPGPESKPDEAFAAGVSLDRIERRRPYASFVDQAVSLPPRGWSLEEVEAELQEEERRAVLAESERLLNEMHAVIEELENKR